MPGRVDISIPNCFCQSSLVSHFLSHALQAISTFSACSRQETDFKVAFSAQAGLQSSLLRRWHFHSWLWGMQICIVVIRAVKNLPFHAQCTGMCHDWVKMLAEAVSSGCCGLPENIGARGKLRRYLVLIPSRMRSPNPWVLSGLPTCRLN